MDHVHLHSTPSTITTRSTARRQQQHAACNYYLSETSG